jgi:hypothetical protein
MRVGLVRSQDDERSVTRDNNSRHTQLTSTASKLEAWPLISVPKTEDLHCNICIKQNKNPHVCNKGNNCKQKHSLTRSVQQKMFCMEFSYSAASRATNDNSTEFCIAIGKLFERPCLTLPSRSITACIVLKVPALPVNGLLLSLCLLS